MQFLLLKRDNNNFNVNTFYIRILPGNGEFSCRFRYIFLVQFYSRIACLPTSDFEAKIFYLCAESWT